MMVTKKFSGWKPAEPLALEPLQRTPVQDGAVLLSSADGSDFGATAATLTFDIMLGEPEMLREGSAVTQLRMLAELAERTIRNLVLVA